MDEVLTRILAWAHAEDAVRVVVLTSTRARAEGPPDALSDYDVIVALTDLDTFDPAAAYGSPAARWGDEHDVHGTRTFFRGVVYEDGTKIDWTLWPANVPGLVAEHGLNDNLDVGYRVLLDKDGTTARWAQPTFRAHIPPKPTEADYVALVEEFWWSATYVARARARGERLFARFALDVDLTHGALRRMLEWSIETGRDWSWKPGAYGRGIEQELPAETARELDAAVGSFERTIALFRRVAHDVADALGYAYPRHADDAVSAYIEKLTSPQTADEAPDGSGCGPWSEHQRGEAVTRRPGCSSRRRGWLRAVPPEPEPCREADRGDGEDEQDPLDGGGCACAVDD
jgi:aminoglycoside 6-adenylyltransferase